MVVVPGPVVVDVNGVVVLLSGVVVVPGPVVVDVNGIVVVLS